MLTKNKKLLEQLEAVVLYCYDDRYGAQKRLYAWNKWCTIGVGYLVPESEWSKYKNGITYNEAMQLLDVTLEPYELTVRRAIKVPLNENQYDALTILCYNIGVAGFKSSSVVKMINGAAGNYPTLIEAWYSWNKDEGKVSPGLVNRRKAEWKLYNEAIQQQE